MMRTDLRIAQQRIFEAALLKPYKLNVKVRLQNLDGDDLSELTLRLLDGQVNIDTSAETTRQCSVTISDPNGTLSLDSDAPSDGALYVDRMIRVDYCVYRRRAREVGRRADLHGADRVDDAQRHRRRAELSRQGVSGEGRSVATAHDQEGH
jgi:hypothetical protein